MNSCRTCRIPDRSLLIPAELGEFLTELYEFLQKLTNSCRTLEIPAEFVEFLTENCEFLQNIFEFFAGIYFKKHSLS